MPPGRSVPGCGHVEKVPQDEMAMLRGDALGVKLNAVHRKRAMRKPHDQAIIGLGRYRKLVRQARSFDHERMVARSPERRIDAAKDAVATVPDLGELAVDLHWSAHHAAPESLADRLMAQANAQHRDRRGGLGDEFKADAGVVRRARTGR